MLSVNAKTERETFSDKTYTFFEPGNEQYPKKVSPSRKKKVS